VTTTWLVRTGNKGYALHECMVNGVVALRYFTVPDATDLTPEQIIEHVAADENIEPASHVRVANMLWQYVHDIKAGDIVITPHDRDRRVFFAEVTGDYAYRDPSPVPDLRHHRAVRWLGRMERSKLPIDRQKQIDRPNTVYEVESNEFWLEQARAATVDAVEPPAPQDAPKVWRRSSRTAVTASAVATAQCTSCFITVPVGSITDGRCVDCQ
jgi:predicted Mrr-cat superfamily restriction endonuclease